MMLFRPKITEEEKQLLKESSIWEYLRDIPDDSEHKAYNLLLAAAYYMNELRGIEPGVMKIMHDNMMYGRIFYFDSSNYPITPPEKEAIIFLRSKIEKISEIRNREKKEIFEVVNTLIMNIIINEGWVEF